MARKPFGGLVIDFGPVKDKTVGEVFGTGKLAPSAATKKFWEFVKKNHLMKKG